MGNTQAMTDPIAVGLSPDKTVGMDFSDMRRGLGALSNPATGSLTGTLGGVFPGGTIGAGRSVRLAASWNGGMVASINGGHFASDRGAGQHYLGFAYATITRTLDQGDAQNPRIDYLVIRVKDPAVDSGVTESAKVEILKGTPSASPVEPTSQLATGDVLLAAVTVPKGATQLSADAFSDRRRFITARGGVTPYSPGDLTAGAYEGDPYYNLKTKALEVWDGTALVPVASPAQWTDFTPDLYYGGSSGPLVAGTTKCALGNGAQQNGRYLLTGKRLDFNICIVWGTSPYNMGTGFITTLLPAGLRHRKVGGEAHIMASLYVADTVTGTYKNYSGNGFIQPDSQVIWPQFVKANGDFDTGFYTVATQQGKPGTGVPNIPAGYPQGGTLTITGTVEVQ